MINEKFAKRYCSEDISLIENYHQAISDKEKMWDVHHRSECDSEGRTLFTKKQLIDMNLYFKRPAKELIFVTKSMHWKIHREMCSKGGKNKAISIFQFSKNGKFIKEWPSAKEAGLQLGIARSGICLCCKGKTKTIGGFVWRYKDSK